MLGRASTPAHVRLARRLARDPQTGCHNWTGPVGHNGYGRLGVDGARVRVHRLAYALAKGPIPAGYEIDHLCRNRRCCNPDHLEAVTGRENTLRGESPAAQHARKTHCKNGHEFTAENTRRGWRGERLCVVCVREADAQRRRSYRAAKRMAKEARCD